MVSLTNPPAEVAVDSENVSFLSIGEVAVGVKYMVSFC